MTFNWVFSLRWQSSIATDLIDMEYSLKISLDFDEAINVTPFSSVA